MTPFGVANLTPNSPITLEPIANAWRSIPEVPIAAQDAFGPKAIVVLHRGRWRGLVPGAGRVFAWLDGRELRATGVSSRMTRPQTLESDEAGRALVIAGTGNSLYAVEPSGAATCLGVLPNGLPNKTTITNACWLPRGGVAFMLDPDICIYMPGADGRLLPRLRFRSLPDVMGLRSFLVGESSDSDSNPRFVLVAMYDDRGAIYGIDAERVHILADFDKLDLASIELFLDETGNRTMLPDGPTIALSGSLTRIEGLDEALSRCGEMPEAELSVEPAPELDAGPDIAARSGAEAKLEVRVTAPPDALNPPSLDRLGRLTAALIRKLRAAPKRSVPDLEILKLIRTGMPHDLRAYVHAWAVHDPNNPAVYEFWMAPPKPETREFIRKHTGEAIQLGTFASGEPIVGRLQGAGDCQVVMIDEEGIPYRYSGIEGFLLDLQMRAPSKFELDDWMG